MTFIPSLRILHFFASAKPVAFRFYSGLSNSANSETVTFHFNGKVSFDEEVPLDDFNPILMFLFFFMEREVLAVGL